jgi:hypothetical protein
MAKDMICFKSEVKILTADTCQRITHCIPTVFRATVFIIYVTEISMVILILP